MTVFDREKAIKFGWRQCSIFNKSSSPLLVKQLPDIHQIENAFYLVLSHPCSLLNANLNSEPTLEYIICQPIDKVDGNATFGKNPRLLHVTLESLNGSSLKLEQKHRGFINKASIAKEPPLVGSIGDEYESLITRWMANRYTTTALPDEFETRLGKQKAKLSKAFALPVGKACKAVYITLNEFVNDLSKSEDYVCSLVFILDSATYDDMEEEEDDTTSQYSIFVNRVTEIFGDAQGIVLNKLLYVSEKSFTIHQAESNKLKRWQFDYVSLAKEGGILPTSW